MVSTKAYLPIGFKPSDLGHLGEGSFCFCTKCRVRLYPRRTAAEKAAARLALASEKAAAELEAANLALAGEAVERETTQAIDVEELELETVDVQDIEAEGVKLNDDEEFCQLSDD
jgi:hypothetical protein